MYGGHYNTGWAPPVPSIGSVSYTYSEASSYSTAPPGWPYMPMPHSTFTTPVFHHPMFPSSMFQYPMPQQQVLMPPVVLPPMRWSRGPDVRQEIPSQTSPSTEQTAQRSEAARFVVVEPDVAVQDQVVPFVDESKDDSSNFHTVRQANKEPSTIKDEPSQTALEDQPLQTTVKNEPLEVFVKDEPSKTLIKDERSQPTVKDEPSDSDIAPTVVKNEAREAAKRKDKRTRSSSRPASKTSRPASKRKVDDDDDDYVPPKRRKASGTASSAEKTKIPNPTMPMPITIDSSSAPPGYLKRSNGKYIVEIKPEGGKRQEYDVPPGYVANSDGILILDEDID